MKRYSCKLLGTLPRDPATIHIDGHEVSEYAPDEDVPHILALDVGQTYTEEHGDEWERTA
jgi:hypothetical protein